MERYNSFWNLCWHDRNLGQSVYFTAGRQIKERLGSILWLLTVAALGAWFGVMAVDREPPYLYLGPESGSKIEPNPAYHEQMVSTNWKLKTVHRDCPRTIERVFSDRLTGKTITTLDATPLSQIVRTSETSLSRAFNLPPNLPNKTDYYVVARFQCNALQWLFSSLMIEVTSPKLPIDIIN